MTKVNEIKKKKGEIIFFQVRIINWVI